VDSKNMTNPMKQEISRTDNVFWILALFLVGIGIWANVYFSAIPLSIRIIAWLFLAIVVIFLVLQTAAGRKSWEFLREARMELRKVVWPTRQETVQTTLIVMAMVIVVALVLWGIDSTLLWAVSMLTGQSG
jgi:preprotein translocase subunit SecE